eukprot:CAMPEP_0183344482 /NCGR_PEP_ID=MMETSP0164_2-20130417/10150_1 /TAXON_ID=221442 /ORGANISM="Coccolithus pelagicus ssp braarudi, Strain PLY182g" /LENGTH=194 /DNA_ID=CAMNT_0025515483 /DNA_START=203 /DNA_END=788 /DNA_ORIENTATION=-
MEANASQRVDCRARDHNSSPRGRILHTTHRAYAARGGDVCVPLVTDLVDGYLARKWSVQSDFGAFLDPVADKLLVCTVLLLLSGSLGAIVSLPAALIVCREIGISALREWMAIRGAHATVAVGWSGKLKTATQMSALQLLLLSLSAASGMTSPIRRLGIALLYISAALTAYSGMQLVERACAALGPEDSRRSQQ